MKTHVFVITANAVELKHIHARMNTYQNRFFANDHLIGLQGFIGLCPYCI